MEERYGNIRAGAKGFVRYQDKSGTELDKETDHLFQRCGSSRDTLVFFNQGIDRNISASLLMMGAMLPFFFFAMYEKNGFPAEKILYFMLRQKILTPGIRPYRSENLYKQLEEKEKLRREVRYLEEKAKGRTGKPQKKQLSGQ